MRRLPGSERGFSLVEVLCAMAIAALSLTALFRGLGGAQSAVRRLDTQLGAEIVAQSILEDERQAAATEAGTRSGSSGPYRWKLIVEPANIALPDKLPQEAKLYRLTAEIAWGARGRLVLDTLKAGR
jgi:prepilin-type N-terminal cleavage/methylation domain-containing protein